MEQLKNMMSNKKHHFIMYIALVFALLLTAPAAVCAGVSNDAYYYEDDFQNSLGLDMTASQGVAIVDGKLVSYATDAKAVSKCISLPQPEGSEFDGWSCLKINLEETDNPGSLSIKRCDDGTVLKTVNLSTAYQPVDLSDILAGETAIRLEWSPGQTGSKADSWEVYGKADGATVINIVADTDTPNACDTVTFTILLSSSGAKTQEPVLRFSLDDINGLRTADIDDGSAEDAEADYGSGVRPYRPLEFVEASPGPNGESADVSSVHDVKDFKNVSGEVVWNLKNMDDGFSDNVTVTLKIPEGYINGKTLAARAVLEYGVPCNRTTVEAISGQVRVSSSAGYYQNPWSGYTNVASGAENINDYYYSNNKWPGAKNSSDVEDVTFTITGTGDCTPLFNHIEVLTPYPYQVLSSHKEGERNPITDSNPVIVHFDRINFYQENARVRVYYDVPEDCGEGSQICTQSEVVGVNPAWGEVDSLCHDVVELSCRRGKNYIHRIMSGNDMPKNYYRWPAYNEYYIGNGSLRAGEYFNTRSPFGGEKERTHTIPLEHSYALIETPEGVTFHGVRFKHYMTRLYKDCTGTAPTPADAEFDHNADPPHPAWKPVDITPWNGPFSNPPDENDPEAVVPPGCRLLNVKDNDNPAWQGPDYGNWDAILVWRVCDGRFDCAELAEETAMSLVGGHIYTYETITDPANPVHDCGTYKAWTLYKESKSWPEVYAWSEQNQVAAGDMARIILNPGNNNKASQYVDGRWIINLYDVKDYIDFKYITGEVLTDGFNIPKPDQNVTGEECNVADDIIFHAPEGQCNHLDDIGCMAWWEVPPACQPPNGWGYREAGNRNHDSYVQMYRFRLNAPILKTTPANTVLDFAAECRSDGLALGANNAVDSARWDVSNCSATASVTVLETPGLDITKEGPANQKAGGTVTDNLTLTNTGNAPANGWYIVDQLPYEEGVNASDFNLDKYGKIYVDRPVGDVMAEYSTDEGCFADPLGSAWEEMAQGFKESERDAFETETTYTINAEAKCIRLRKNPDSQWDFMPGDKISSAIDFTIPNDDALKGQRICNRALTGASVVDFGGTSDLYPVETVNVCTEVNDGVDVRIKKTFKYTPLGIEWTIKVWNASGTTAKNITVTDDLPDTMSYQGLVGDLPSGWKWENNVEPAIGTTGKPFVIIIEELTPYDGNPEAGSDEGSFTFLTSLASVTLPGGIKNCATAIPEEGLGSEGCKDVPDLKMELGKTLIAEDRAGATPEKTELFPGDEFTYVITVKNTYTEPVYLRITDVLDDYLDYAGGFAVNGAAASGDFFSDGKLDYQHLDPADSLTLKFKVKVKDTAPDGYKIENRAEVTACTDSDDPESCSAPQETPVVNAWVVNTLCDFNLRVRANRVQVQPTWTDNGTAPYQLYRSDGTDTDFRRIATVGDIMWVMATYLDRDVQNGNTYSYYVANRDGCRSDIASITPESIVRVDEIVDLDDDSENPPSPGDSDIENPGDGDDDPMPPGDPDIENPGDGSDDPVPPVNEVDDPENGSDTSYVPLVLEPDPSPVPVPIYRLYSPTFKRHHYCDEYEANYLLANYPEDIWTLETGAFYAYRNADNGTAPVYRLYNEYLQEHLFTMDANEKETLVNADESSWKYEGVAFYVDPQPADGTVPVWRLYSDDLQTHLLTTDVNEKERLLADGWHDEGVAYYVYSAN